MSFWRETEFVGRVVSVPEVYEFQSRPQSGQTGSVRRLMFRLEEPSGRVWAVRYEGPIEGSLQLGDLIAVFGYTRAHGTIRATRIFHDGGARPVRITGMSRMCLLALVCTRCPGLLLPFYAVRDSLLSRSHVGRYVISRYYQISQTLCLLWLDLAIDPHTDGTRA